MDFLRFKGYFWNENFKEYLQIQQQMYIILCADKNYVLLFFIARAGACFKRMGVRELAERFL